MRLSLRRIFGHLVHGERNDLNGVLLGADLLRLTRRTVQREGRSRLVPCGARIALGRGPEVGFRDAQATIVTHNRVTGVLRTIQELRLEEGQTRALRSAFDGQRVARLGVGLVFVHDDFVEGCVGRFWARSGIETPLL